MPTLEELLRKSVKGASDRQAGAAGVIHQAVGELDQAARSISDQTLGVTVRGWLTTDFATVFEVSAAYAGDDTRRVAALRVPKLGYPIGVLSTDEAGPVDPDMIVRNLDSDDAVREYFRTLATDPDSPLVLYLAFAVQQRDEEKRFAGRPG